MAPASGVSGGSAPFVLTLEMDGEAFAAFEALRRRHYAPERNLVPAHVTLFYRLPGERSRGVKALLRAVTSTERPIEVEVGGARAMERGVAVFLEVTPASRVPRATGGGVVAVARRSGQSRFPPARHDPDDGKRGRGAPHDAEPKSRRASASPARRWPASLELPQRPLGARRPLPLSLALRQRRLLRAGDIEALLAQEDEEARSDDDRAANERMHLRDVAEDEIPEDRRPDDQRVLVGNDD